LASTGPPPRTRHRRGLRSQQSSDEYSSDQFYRCYNSGEAYGAAWLASKELILASGVVKLEERQHMETAGILGNEASRFPVKSVDLFEFSVEHLSWLERRVGLRDMKGPMKERLDGDMRNLMRRRQESLQSLYEHHYAPVLEPLPAEAPSFSSLAPPEPSPAAPIVATMPFFAFSDDCSNAVEQNKCGAGSSAPEMRARFLNLTFWSIQPLTSHITISVCSEIDEDFVRRKSGLPFFDVLRHDCHIFSKKYNRVIFKPSLLGAKTVNMIQERLKHDPRWRHFSQVYYTEADQVLHCRDPLRLSSAVVSSRAYAIPHRLMPISDPRDLPALVSVDRMDHRLPRWVYDDLDRVQRVKAKRRHFQVPLQSPFVQSPKYYRCCLDRGQCRTRKHWLSWKLPPKDIQLDLVTLGGSFTIVVGDPDFGNLQFRACRVEVLARPEECPL